MVKKAGNKKAKDPIKKKGKTNKDSSSEDDGKFNWSDSSSENTSDKEN